jgi:hypothetical protein
MLAVDKDLKTCTSGKRASVLLAFAVLPVVLAGCGSGSDEKVTPRAPASESSASASTELTVVSTDEAGKSVTWTLTCDPVGGTHPDADAACAALAAKGKTAIPPVSKDMMCTQQFGGSQTAKVTGTWQDDPVNAAFSRTNGCEISRWNALKGLLPAAAGVGAQ